MTDPWRPIEDTVIQPPSIRVEPEPWTQGPPEAWQPDEGFAATATPPARPRRMRWVVAAAATAIVVAAAASLAFFATSGQPRGIGPRFLPAGTFAYAELRLDMPGSQREELIKLLSHVPGFADPAAFDQKMDSSFDNTLGQISGQAVLYTRDIKPWFSGQLAVGLIRPPTTNTDPTAMANDILIGIGVKERVALQATIDRLQAVATDRTFTTETYGSATVTTVSRDGDPEASWTVTDTVLLFAPTPVGIHAGLDVLNGSAASLEKDATFKKTFDSVPADRLGAIYVEMAQIVPLIRTQMGSSVGMLEQLGLPFGEMIDRGLDSLPTQIVAYAAAASDHVTIEYFGARPILAPNPSVRSTDLAAHMPADSMVYVELRDVGATVKSAVSTMQTLYPEMHSESAVAPVESLLGAKLGDYLDFVQDMAVAGSYDGETIKFGIAATLTDEAIATTRIDRLLSAIGLAGAAGLPVTSTQTAVNGVTITTIAIGAGAGLPAGLPFEPKITVALTGGKLYLGLGDFASEAVARPSGDSLAGNQRYASALAAAGTSNAAVVYVDVTAVRRQIEALASVDASYTINQMPYAETVDRLILVAGGTDALTSARLQVFVQ